uniref:Cadherin domain-containing protein n=1 Tax=Erpetoichthys calabaricus TaxID=27687 RepID=A0A8C4SH87_ERPCA
MANREGFFHSLLFCCLLDLAIGQISYSIPEEADPGTFVGNLAKDLELDIRDFEARSFGIAPRRNMKKRYLDVNTKTGILFISERIDREELCPNTDTCVIHIEAIVHNPLHLYRVEITVVDINDNAPSFPLETLTLSIAESAIPGARFPLESASDPDVGTNSLKSYTLSTNDFFNVDVQTSSDKGKSIELLLKKALDREKEPDIHLVLTAFDGGKPSKSGTVLIIVEVLDTNDNAPVFTQSLYKASVYENTPEKTVIMRLNATDADEGLNGEVKYLFSKMSPKTIFDTFDIDSRTGEIYLRGTLDFEETNTYEFHVQAEDRGQIPMVAHCKVIVEVIDVNDNAPEITVSSLTSTVMENTQTDSLPGTVIAIINVQDKDSGRNGQVICFIDNNIPFKLKSSLNNFYSLETDGILDREKTPQYNITIVATDQGEPSLSATYAILLAVSDVNDNPPRFEQQRYTTYIMENNSPGSSFFSLHAKDDDSGVNSKITYFVQETRINNQSASSFVSVNLDEGVIYAVRSYDYEQLSHFQILVTAKDGGSPSLSGSVIVDVYIQDQNDNPPEVLYPVQSKSHPITELIPRSADVGYLVTKVVAVDKDSSNNAWLSYKIIKSTDQTLFKVGIHDGELRTLRQITEKDFSKYKLTILIEDNGQPPYTVSVNVNVAVIDNFAQAFSEFNDLAQRNNDDGDMQFYLILSLVIVSFVFLILILVVICLKIHKWRRCKLFNEGSNGILPVIPYYPPRYAEVGATGTLCHVYNYEVCLKTDSGDSELTNRKPIVQNVVDVKSSGTETNTHKGNLDSTVEEDIIQVSFSPIPFCSTSQAPSDLSRSVQPDSSLGSGWATQGHSQSCPEATPLISWLCA